MAVENVLEALDEVEVDGEGGFCICEMIIRVNWRRSDKEVDGD